MARPVRFAGPAAAMPIERGLDRAWVLRTMEAPTLDEPDPVRPARRRAFAPVPERDGRILRVVYEAGEGGVIVVTAFLDRGRKP